jgi:hypothetical protein
MPIANPVSNKLHQAQAMTFPIGSNVICDLLLWANLPGKQQTSTSTDNDVSSRLERFSGRIPALGNVMESKLARVSIYSG